MKAIKLNNFKNQRTKVASSHGTKGITGSKNYTMLVASPGKRLLAKVKSFKSADAANNQRVAGKNRPKEGTKTGGAIRHLKKGMVDLPKPPAHT